MGATNFSTTATGKDAAAAYDAAVAGPVEGVGDGGYTGTIAEKDGYVEFPLPDGVTADELEDTVWRVLWDVSQAWRDDRPVPDEHSATLERWYGRTDARRILAVADDKWGPCVAVRLDPAGDGWHYLFFGMASC